MYSRSHLQMSEIFITKVRRVFTYVISFDLFRAISKSDANHAAKNTFLLKDIYIITYMAPVVRKLISANPRLNRPNQRNRFSVMSACGVAV